jgi:hypothetical protein
MKLIEFEYLQMLYFILLKLADIQPTSLQPNLTFHTNQTKPRN